MAIADVTPGGADPRWAPTLFVGLVGLLIFIGTFIALEAWYRSVDRDERYTKVVSQTPEELERLDGVQLERLEGYRWIDPEKGLVGIPIDRAIEIVAEESRNK